MANAIDDGFEIKKDDENDPKFGTYEYFEASSTDGKPRPTLITPRLCRSRYQIKNELTFTFMRFALSTLGASLNICFANW